MPSADFPRERVRIVLRGAVQGVGFRPFVYRLAHELRLDGWVSNTAAGVFVEAEGIHAQLAEFARRIEQDKPPLAVLQSMEVSWLDVCGLGPFEIRKSADTGAKTALILPDIATCAACLREIFEPRDRRYRYPFTNCTNCGPRFSIIEALPYDRANTSMRKFAMCRECEREYHDPRDRRFHAQPNACPRCGPRLALWDADGAVRAQDDAALIAALAAIRRGEVLALKGLGGFQLIVDARNESAVSRLRERKRREEKPFAVMVASLAYAQELCEVDPLEERLLLSPETPIVLLRLRAGAALAASVAPGNPHCGVMLPYTPLHHLLLHSLGTPIVATSGNRSDEPICIDENEALERLRGLADLFLVHDRPIVRHMDDSVVRIMAGRELVLRRARGYAPLPVQLPSATGPILALGAHLKNTVALGVGQNVFVSQHLGDLETQAAHEAFMRTVSDLPQLYGVTPERIACDLHPDYLSTKHATQLSAPIVAVQHHWAHIAACMAENELAPPLLGIAWDGTGYGTDGTIWGGEFLMVTASGFERFAHLRQFPLPGGNAVAKEPRRSQLGLLFELFGAEVWNRPDLTGDFTSSELKPLRQMLAKGINTPITSSAGRLFDAVAALLGLRARSSFEGQAAMALEFSLDNPGDDSYPFDLREGQPLIVDWGPMIMAILEDRGTQTAAVISAKFHHTLAEMIVAIVLRSQQERVALSGGCFQNGYLTERTIARLTAAGIKPYWHQRIPPNDGGISLGQIFAATFPP